MSGLPFTFGVELEFCVAFMNHRGQAPDPTVEAEGKIVRFAPGADDGEEYQKPNAVHSHIRKTLSEAGLRTKRPKTHFASWIVVSDSSIRVDKNPAGDPWDHYTAVEIISPKLDFTPACLREVEKVCDILNKTYKIMINDSCGLHVHIGHNKEGFRFPDVKKFLAFAYTFEPQLNSLLSFPRINHDYGGSLRDRSLFVEKFSMTYARRPVPSHFCAAIMACKTRAYALTRSNVDPGTEEQQHGLALCARGEPGDWSYHTKYSRYNMRGVATDPDKLERSVKPTIEFRGMEATTDGEKIANWVQVIVGIMEFVENSNPSTFTRLLTWAWEAEKYELMGDYREGDFLPRGSRGYERKHEKIQLDPERFAKYGPVLADRDFTIIDLLTWLGLDAQADYYRTRWIKHPAPLDRFQGLRSNINWNFQKAPESGDEEDGDEARVRLAPGSDQYESCAQLAETFELLRIADVALKIAGEERLERTLADEEIWPKHSIYWSAELMDELAPDVPDF